MARDFTDDERVLLRFLTVGENPTALLARSQIETARFADYWGEGDQSFNIESAPGVVCLPVEDGIYHPSDKYFTLSSGEQGGLMLWVKSGKIDALEVYWWAESIPRLPLPNEISDVPPLEGRETARQ